MCVCVCIHTYLGFELYIIFAPISNDGLVVICYFTTVGVIDIELVEANHSIGDCTNVPFPCCNVRVSDAASLRFAIQS